MGVCGKNEGAPRCASCTCSGARTPVFQKARWCEAQGRRAPGGQQCARVRTARGRRSAVAGRQAPSLPWPRRGRQGCSAPPGPPGLVVVGSSHCPVSAAAPPGGLTASQGAQRGAVSDGFELQARPTARRSLRKPAFPAVHCGLHNQREASRCQRFPASRFPGNWASAESSPIASCFSPSAPCRGLAGAHARVEPACAQAGGLVFQARLAGFCVETRACVRQTLAAGHGAPHPL